MAELGEATVAVGFKVKPETKKKLEAALKQASEGAGITAIGKGLLKPGSNGTRAAVAGLAAVGGVVALVLKTLTRNGEQAAAAYQNAAKSARDLQKTADALYVSTSSIEQGSEVAAAANVNEADYKALLGAIQGKITTGELGTGVTFDKNGDFRSADSALSKLLDTIKTLPGEARQAWERDTLGGADAANFDRLLKYVSSTGSSFSQLQGRQPYTSKSTIDSAIKLGINAEQSSRAADRIVGNAGLNNGGIIDSLQRMQNRANTAAITRFGATDEESMKTNKLSLDTLSGIEGLTDGIAAAIPKWVGALLQAFSAASKGPWYKAMSNFGAVFGKGFQSGLDDIKTLGGPLGQTFLDLTGTGGAIIAPAPKKKTKN